MAGMAELKRLINAIDNLVETGCPIIGVTRDDVSGIFKFELAQFMMYLSASDGEIKWEEASFISDLCDLNLTPQTVGKFIREHNIYSTDFETTIPTSVQIIVAVDNKMLELNPDDDSDPFDGLLNAYKGAGNMFINSDDDNDENEERDFAIYINTLNEYINNNSNRRKKSVFGFKKNGQSEYVSAKSGVSAPKKG